MARMMVSTDEPPDLLLIGGDVVTLWPELPRAEAVAAKDGLVLAVGSSRELLRLAGPRTTTIDCRGKLTVPGFHDTHIHLLACASKRLGVDCSPPRASSIRQIQESIRDRARSMPAGTWIRAGDYDEFRLAEKRHPTRWDLDAAAPDHPVKLRHRSLHACVLNSAALILVGIAQGDSPLPGVDVDVDPATREPTGLLYEYGRVLSDRVIPPVKESDLRLALRQVLRELLANGVTSVQDATFRNGVQEWDRFREICSEGGPWPRIGFMVGQPRIEQFAEEGMGPGYGDDRLRIGPTKIMLTESGGDFQPSPEELESQVCRAHRLGYQVAIHAVEESAICVAMEALAEAMDREGWRAHRIEHCSVLPPPLLERLAELRIGISTQPGFLLHSGDRYLAELGEQIHGWLYPLKSLLDVGVQVGAGSDAPVTPPRPLEGIRAAVTRLSRGGNVVGERERITVEEALRLYTTSAAQICGESDRKGSIQPGKLADLVVLSADPTSTEPHHIEDVQVEMTIVGGRVAWRRGEHG